jgi:NAD(P)-dependent dehydrogenase (short-subunit alcohol dehydrogenase family)
VVTIKEIVVADQSSGNVFITGAAAGIGAATAHLLADAGYRVFAGIHRDPGALSGLADVHAVPIDVTDSASVAAAAATISDAVGTEGVQAIVNNAGVIVQGPLELVPPDEMRRQFEINTFGPANVVQAFLPLLRIGRGRVINISAPTARVSVPFMGPIGASKAALVSLSDALRIELGSWNIPVVLIEPGGTATAIFDKARIAASSALANADPARVALYDQHLAAVSKAAASQKLRPVDPVARVIVKAVTTSRPKRHYTAGSDARIAGFASHLPSGLRDRLVAGALGVANIKAPA